MFDYTAIGTRQHEFGDRTLPFICENHALGYLQDERFNGSWRVPYSGNLYEIYCEYVIVDEAIGRPKVSEDL